MIVPITEISAESLRSIAESFVLREGTDYGEQEIDFETKVEAVLQQLHCGDVLVEYSELHESIDLVLKTDIKRG
jgi:hypothetical protein